MPRAEIIQIDPVLAAEQRQLVLVSTLRQELFFVPLERVHLHHVAFGVFVSHDVDGRRKRLVAPCVIAVRVRVDDRRDWLVGDLADLLENGRSVAGELRVDHHDTRVGDEHAGVTAREHRSVRRVGCADVAERCGSIPRGVHDDPGLTRAAGPGGMGATRAVGLLSHDDDQATGFGGAAFAPRPNDSSRGESFLVVRATHSVDHEGQTFPAGRTGTQVIADHRSVRIDSGSQSDGPVERRR